MKIHADPMLMSQQNRKEGLKLDSEIIDIILLHHQFINKHYSQFSPGSYDFITG
jgi:hypothetical protein